MLRASRRGLFFSENKLTSLNMLDISSGVTITHFRISGFFRLLLFTLSAFSKGPNDISEIDQSSIATAGTPLRFQVIF